MLQKIYQLDGSSTGIVARLAGKNRYLTNKDGSIRVFNSIEMAKLIAPSIILNQKFEYGIKIDDSGNIIDLSKCYINDSGVISCYDNETDEFMIIKQLDKRRTCNLGYIVLENGDSERIDKKVGQKHQFELMKIIRSVLIGILKENGVTASIKSFERKSYEIVANVKGTSCKIHILHNSKLMDLNQERKSQGKRCLPFNKEMDKYTTFYIYIDKDVSEPLRLNGDKTAGIIQDYIMCDLVDYYPDLHAKYVPIEYNGSIEI